MLAPVGRKPDGVQEKHRERFVSTTFLDIVSFYGLLCNLEETHSVSVPIKSEDDIGKARWIDGKLLLTFPSVAVM